MRRAECVQIRHYALVSEAWSLEGGEVHATSVPALLRDRISSGLRWSAFEHSSGEVVMFVTNGERAMVAVLDEPGDPGSHAVDPTAGPGTSGGYVLDNGQADEYLNADTVPVDTGITAVAHFIGNRVLDPTVIWKSNR
jgi:hypothetical protein